MAKPAHIIVLEKERQSIVSQIDVLGTLLWKGMVEEKLISQSQLNQIKEAYHTNEEQVTAMLDHLQRNEDEEDFETFLYCLDDNDNGRVAKKLNERLKEVKGRGFNKVYDIGTEEKGNVIIINYTQMKTQSNEIKTRDGSENDVRKMESLFLDLGFSVRVFENLVYGDLISKLRDFAFQADRDNIKSVFVIIMAHGGQRENKQYICTHDGRNVFIEEEIRNIFDSANVPTLARKPKIFIIQACRGVKEDDGVFVVPADMETEGMEPRNRNQRIPHFTDYLFAFPSQQDHVSYRNTATGSLYLQELDHVFREKSSTMHVVDMLTMVLNNFVHSRNTGQGFIQSPETVTGLSKFFYIFPEYL